MSGDESPQRWRKSSFSGNGDCLEWLIATQGVRVRQSSEPSGAELSFTNSEWQAFLAGVRAGEADLPPGTR